MYCTHQEEHAEVGQFSEEILHADRVRVEGEVAADALVQLLHVLVHRGQLLVLLSRMFAEAVGKEESREIKKEEKTHLYTSVYRHEK